MPLFKRIFGHGKTKASNTVVALCIGDHSRVALQVTGQGNQQLDALLAHVDAEDCPASINQPAHQSSKGNIPGAHQTSFKAFRHLIQHLGGGTPSTPIDEAEAESQRLLSQFLKQLGAYTNVSFITAAEDGLLSRDRVLAKLTKLFKQSTAPVVIVSYCGPSDERGNWRLAGQIPGVSGGSGSCLSSGGSGSGTAVVSFREVSMLWQRYRKHSQRLVLLLDCANSGYWVSALRMLSKAEQLELSLGVQASDSSSPGEGSDQLNYQPGIFLQFFLQNNKWRREPRRVIQQPTSSPQQQLPPQPTYSLTSGGRSDQWLPGMQPTYYATWLDNTLADYGIALRFFNFTESARNLPLQPGRPRNCSEEAPGKREAYASTPTSPSEVPGRPWRSSTSYLASLEKSNSFNRPSRQGDEVTSPSSDLWVTQRSGLGIPSPGTVQGRDNTEPQMRTYLGGSGSMRIMSLPDAARRRLSSLADYYATSMEMVTSPSQPFAGSPNSPLRAALSSSQPAWQPSPTTSAFALRSPTMPGADALKKSRTDMDEIAGTLSQLGDNACASCYGTIYEPGTEEPTTSTAYGDNPASAQSGQMCVPGQNATSSSKPVAISVNPRAIAAEYGRRAGDVGQGGEGAGTDWAVQQSGEVCYQSDTVALAWDRRGAHAGRSGLERDQIPCGMSNTGPVAQGGFAKELLGALHEVATDQRLRARRAPLEGDESLDTMMEDADLERRASNASLPSYMLPRDMFNGRLSGDSVSPNTRVQTLANSVEPSAHGGVLGKLLAGSVIAAVTPRHSVLGAPGSPPVSITEQQQYAGVIPRQVSRLFLVSTATDAPLVQEELSEEGTDGQQADVHGDGSSPAEASQQPTGRHQAMQVEHGSRTGHHRTNGWSSRPGVGGAGGLADMGIALLQAGGSEGPETSGLPGGAGMSVEWPHPAASPASGPGGQDRVRQRASGAGATLHSMPSSHILRSLLRQRVSIASSIDSEAAVQDGCQRRPGRFEMAGSESSSFVFGDDCERFEILRLLREQGTENRDTGEVYEEGDADRAVAQDRTSDGDGNEVGRVVAARAGYEGAVLQGIGSLVGAEGVDVRNEGWSYSGLLSEHVNGGCFGAARAVAAAVVAECGDERVRHL